MIAAPFLAADVFRDRDDAERLVGSLVGCTEAAREHDRGAAGRSAERRAFAVRDALVVLLGRVFADFRGLDRLRRVDAAALRIEEIELRRIGRIHQRVVGRAGERILLRQLDELERIGDETLDPAFGEIARRRRRDLLALHHAKARRAMRGFFDELRLAETHACRELCARTEETFGDRDAAFRRHSDDAITEGEELFELGVDASTHLEEA